MRAKPGDHLVIRGHQVGGHQREALVLDVRGDDGGPPYLVRWLDDEHEGLFFPGSDADVESRPPRQ